MWWWSCGHRSQPWSQKSKFLVFARSEVFIINKTAGLQWQSNQTKKFQDYRQPSKSIQLRLPEIEKNLLLLPSNGWTNRCCTFSNCLLDIRGAKIVPKTMFSLFSIFRFQQQQLQIQIRWEEKNECLRKN